MLEENKRGILDKQSEEIDLSRFDLEELGVQIDDDELILEELELPLNEESESKKIRAALIAILGFVPFPILSHYLWQVRQGKNKFSENVWLAAYCDFLTMFSLTIPTVLSKLNEIPADTERYAVILTTAFIAYLRYIVFPVGFSGLDRYGSELKEFYDDALGIIGLLLEELEVPADYYDKVAFGTDKYPMDLRAFSSTDNSDSK